MPQWARGDTTYKKVEKQTFIRLICVETIKDAVHYLILSIYLTTYQELYFVILLSSYTHFLILQSQERLIQIEL